MNERYFTDFHIAGFTFYDGIDVFQQLTLDATLTLKAEPDNRFDPYAVAIYFNKTKLGYIPKENNKEINKFLNLGYSQLFEAHINRIATDSHPEGQIGVVVRIAKVKEQA
jgi:hypothetical protein